jgi:hypothetical protein
VRPVQVLKIASSAASSGRPNIALMSEVHAIQVGSAFANGFSSDLRPLNQSPQIVLEVIASRMLGAVFATDLRADDLVMGGLHTDVARNVYTLGNFGTNNGVFVDAQRLVIFNDASNNTGTINFGSGAYIITDAAHPAGSHGYVQTAANGAGLANLDTAAQWAIINNVHGGLNSDTLTFTADNVQTFVNLGAVNRIQDGIGNALGLQAHMAVEFTVPAGNTFIFDHADSSFALTPADAMVELTGIHPIAAISATHEITFAT